MVFPSLGRSISLWLVSYFFKALFHWHKYIEMSSQTGNWRYSFMHASRLRVGRNNKITPFISVTHSDFNTKMIHSSISQTLARKINKSSKSLILYRDQVWVMIFILLIWLTFQGHFIKTKHPTKQKNKLKNHKLSHNTYHIKSLLISSFFCSSKENYYYYYYLAYKRAFVITNKKSKQKKIK